MPRRALLPNIQPARLDMQLYRGDSLSVKLHLQSQGVAVDVSADWEFKAYIRASADGPYISEFDVLVDPEKGADPVNGIIRLWLPFEDARLLPATSVWDLQATQFVGGEAQWVRTALRGIIYTTGDVTYPDPYVDIPPTEGEG